ncbi:MAG: LysR family transcriptional regulator [Streptococcaceae bacterium]|jgi:DNA-binding transcriptional LysR family regulator|nr:LysR family transcriptional regulator [Streptococcaceae bacterium]
MHLSDLKNFVAIVDEGSISKAAEKSYISQPSITNSLIRLEEELGKVLLLRGRGRKKHVITSEGEIVYARAKKILREIETIYDDVSTVNKKVKLGVPPIIGSYLFPKLASQMSKETLARIELVEEGSEKLRELLLAQKIDMALIGSRLPIHDATFEKYFVMRDTFSIFMGKSHPLATSEMLNFSELVAENFISLGKDYVQYHVLKTLFEENNCLEKINEILVTNELQTMKSLIGKEVGIGLMISSSAGSRADLAVIPLEKPEYFYIYLIFRQESILSRAEQEIRKALIKANEGR